MMIRSALISDDKRYRYALRRDWRKLGQPRRLMTFVMLNPSTADGSIDDPTIRRCLHFAVRENRTELLVVNLFAWRSTSPEMMLEEWAKGVDIVGSGNMAALAAAALESASPNQSVVVFAWGALNVKCSKSLKQQMQTHAEKVAGIFTTQTHCYTLGFTKDGMPRHPLYLKNDAPLLSWRSPTTGV